MRRFVLAVGMALVVGGAPVGVAAAASAASASSAVRTALPGPTGHERVGTVSLHLVDPSRRDPFVPSDPVRELMVSIWYPADDTAGVPTAPWMLPGAAAHFLAAQGIPQGAVVLPPTVGHQDAPIDRRPGGLPVLLYSPGLGTDRTIDTALVQDLASRGYVVVTIDHTHDASEVEFPGGRVEVSALTGQTDPDEVVAVREADTRFVLDQLAVLDHGGNPSVEHTPLPRGLAGGLNLSRVGMFGWSIGGATAAATMHDDPRIAAGVDMDGTLFGPVVTDGLSRPFLLMSSQSHNRDTDPSWASFWAAQRGYRLDLKLLGSEHWSYSDAEYLLPEIDPALGVPPATQAQEIGTVDPGRAYAAETSYLAAFFGQELLGHHAPLLNGPSPRFPEIEFVP